jgi:hypothetical protein
MIGKDYGSIGSAVPQVAEVEAPPVESPANALAKAMSAQRVIYRAQLEYFSAADRRYFREEFKVLA